MQGKKQETFFAIIHQKDGTNIRVQLADPSITYTDATPPQQRQIKQD